MKMPALSTRIWLLAVLVILSAFVLLPQESLFAQAEEVAAEEVTAPGDKSLFDMFKAGGWAMYPLLLLSISGFGLIIFNFLAIKPEAFLSPKTITSVDEALSNLDVEEAKRLCEETTSPVTNIVAAGLSRVDTSAYDETAVKEALEEASAEELSGPFVLINYLSVVGTLSPMVGLLGTVSGMVKAFNAIASEGVGNPQQLADNISEALITTATGMIIGIPAMFFYFFFKNRYGKIASRIGRISGDLFFTFNSAIRRQAGS